MAEQESTQQEGAQEPGGARRGRRAFFGLAAAAAGAAGLAGAVAIPPYLTDTPTSAPQQVAGRVEEGAVPGAVGPVDRF
ncbi:hypothetical protein AB0K48_30685, partial [Nonomuraea sp. NPDC055795]